MADYITQGAIKIDLMNEDDADLMDAIVAFLDGERDNFTSGVDEMDETAQREVLSGLDQFIESLNLTTSLKAEVREMIWHVLAEAVEDGQSVPEKRRIIGRYFYLGSTNQFDPNFVANIARIAIEQFDLPPIGFTYAEVCDRPLMRDGFGGGMVLVTKNKTFFNNAHALLEKQRSEVAAEQPVSSAAHAGSLDDLKASLEAGGDLDEADGQPLRWAMRAGRAEVVDYLLTAGARIDWPNMPNVREFHPEIQARLEAETLRRAASAQPPAAPRIARRGL